MKRNAIIVIACCLIGVGLFFVYTKSPEKQAAVTSYQEQVASTPVVSLVLNDGEKISTYSGVTAANALEVLSIVSQNEKIPLQTKTYDFGMFVQKVGEKESNASYGWIYFVNGVSGDVAAEKAELKTGDIVEWKYTKSIY